MSSMVQEDAQIKIELHDDLDVPVRHASLERVYSAPSSSSSSSSLCCVSAAGSHNVISKKVNNAQKLPTIDDFEGYGGGGDGGIDSRQVDSELGSCRRPEIVRVYSRRERRRRESVPETKELDENAEQEEKKKKKRRVGNGELMKLGVDSTTLSLSTTPRLRGCRINAVCNGTKQNGSSRSNKSSVKGHGKLPPASAGAKKWVRLSFDGVGPLAFIGLQCKASVKLYGLCVVGKPHHLRE